MTDEKKDKENISFDELMKKAVNTDLYPKSRKKNKGDSKDEG